MDWKNPAFPLDGPLFPRGKTVPAVPGMELAPIKKGQVLCCCGGLIPVTQGIELTREGQKLISTDAALFLKHCQ
jgi:hypothetical protein